VLLPPENARSRASSSPKHDGTPLSPVNRPCLPQAVGGVGGARPSSRQQRPPRGLNSVARSPPSCASCPTSSSAPTTSFCSSWRRRLWPKRSAASCSCPSSTRGLATRRLPGAPSWRFTKRSTERACAPPLLLPTVPTPHPWIATGPCSHEVPAPHSCSTSMRPQCSRDPVHFAYPPRAGPFCAFS